MAEYRGVDNLEFEYMDGKVKTLLVVSATVFGRTPIDDPKDFLHNEWHTDRQFALYEEEEDFQGRKFWREVELDAEDILNILVTRLIHECSTKVERKNQPAPGAPAEPFD
jgi:hypothetical protein